LTQEQPTRLRKVRSFVRRAGRLTGPQARALEEAWPSYGIEAPEGPLDLDRVFGRTAPRTLEIGFGNGESLAALALGHPERDYLGVEVHEPGVGHLLIAIQRKGIGNLRLIRADAVEVVGHWLPAAGLDEVLVFFPDPWPKKRHHKRRLIQPGFLAGLARVMAPGARLHLATDWAHYAEHMLGTSEASPWFDNADPGGGFASRPASREMTKFERRGMGLGHEVYDLVYRRNERPWRPGDEGRPGA
jgi:tRNA (guanine-N7-)-methyltransferase